MRRAVFRRITRLFYSFSHSSLFISDELTGVMVDSASNGVHRPDRSISVTRFEFPLRLPASSHLSNFFRDIALPYRRMAHAVHIGFGSFSV
jgi:hypothetical protein